MIFPSTSILCKSLLYITNKIFIAQLSRNEEDDRTSLRKNKGYKNIKMQKYHLFILPIFINNLQLIK